MFPIQLLRAGKPPGKKPSTTSAQMLTSTAGLRSVIFLLLVHSAQAIVRLGQSGGWLLGEQV
jgi:hypothetical protein